MKHQKPYRHRLKAKEIKRWSLPLQYVADILNPTEDQSRDTVRFHMQCLLYWVYLTYSNESDQLMVSNLKSYTKGFWKGLFTCYDHLHVPRTNNDHERFFRKTKTRHRRMTGLRSWNEYVNWSVVEKKDHIMWSNKCSQIAHAIR